MTSRVRAGLLLLAVAAGLAGCNGSQASAPTAPTTQMPPDATLSGLVFTMTTIGRSPVAGARVRLDGGSYRQDTLTDQNGRYRLTDLHDGPSTVTTTLDGYDTDMRMITVSSDMTLDIGLVARVTYTLSGMVFELTPSGRAPVAGVEVYCDSCGSPVGHTSVDTDADGFYSLTWASNGTHPLFVTKAGYEIVDSTGTMRDGLGRVTATVRGDTRFDIQLARR